MAEAILKLFPGCPPGEARVIAAHTALRGSGRVGRTSAGRCLETEALTAAVIAAIRHRQTRYDELSASEYEFRNARHEGASGSNTVVHRSVASRAVPQMSGRNFSRLASQLPRSPWA